MTKDRIPLWKAAVADSIVGTIVPNWAHQIREQWRQQVAQDKAEKQLAQQAKRRSALKV
jgi:hypothetical protein